MNSYLDAGSQGVEGAEELRESIAAIRSSTYTSIGEMFTEIIEEEGGVNRLPDFKEAMYHNIKHIIDAIVIEILNAVYPNTSKIESGYIHPMAASSYYYTEVESGLLSGFFKTTMETAREKKVHSRIFKRFS